jgi:hypothetical protein
MIRLSRPRLRYKRPRFIPQHRFYPVLSEMRKEQECEYCDACLSEFQNQVDSERPGHVWTILKGKVAYIEDCIAESMLGRPLNPDEVVVHKDGNPFHNDRANLEIVKIPDMEE